MAIEILDKIPADFATTSGVQALSVRPNQPSTYGVGGLDAKSLKAFFDKFPQKVADKYNAICDILSDPTKSLSHIAWEGDKSLADFFLTIANGEFAKAIKAKDPTTNQAASVQDILDNIHSIVSFLDAYIGKHGADKTLADEYVQKDADGDVTVNGDITVNNGEVSASKVVASSSANLNSVTTYELKVAKQNGNRGNATIAGNLEVGGIVKVNGESVITKRSGGYASIPALDTDTINNNNGIHSMSDIAAEGKVSGETIKAYGSITGASLEATGNVKAASGSITGNLGVDGNLDVKGNLNVKGTTVTHSHETLAVQDNLIVTNSSGASFSSSGLAILTPSGSCYGILYLPNGNSGEAVYIGEGRIDPTSKEFVFGTHKDGGFTPNEAEAVPLAARSGTWYNKSIPMWDASKNAFVSSGLNANTIGGITEWTYKITEPSQFTTESLAMLHGNILVLCDVLTEYGDSVSVTIPSAIKMLNFNGHRTDYSLVGHSDCRLIGANIDVDSSYENKVTNFGSVEFCGGSGQYVRCKRIAHSSLWNATNCTFITDCTPAYFESHYATFNGCSNITNVRVTDLEEDYGIEFIDCDHISNVSIDAGGDGKILYTNCTYVDALTCAGYGAGVPYVGADGIVSFLTSAEGGSYGS